VYVCQYVPLREIEGLSVYRVYVLIGVVSVYMVYDCVYYCDTHAHHVPLREIEGFSIRGQGLVCMYSMVMGLWGVYVCIVCLWGMYVRAIGSHPITP
jgi:hypothetical protein